MHIERAFRIINLLDVPEKKRKFWPQHSIVILDKDGNILDVVKYFEGSATDISFANMRYYPGSLSFATEVGWYPTIEEFTKRVRECFEPNTVDTYIVGKGLVKNMSPDDKEKYLPNKETKDKLSFLRKFRRWWRENG